jgi:tRNA pseudouridine38-40 synthase
MRIRLRVAYVGTRFAGWQRQANAVAVQQLVEEALAALTGERVRAIGAGRTDAGVHATGQAVSCELMRELPLDAFVHGSNHYLPADVRVLAATAVPAGFDASRDAIAKRYAYRVALAPPTPLVAPFVCHVQQPLARPLLDDATRALVGGHDFAAFALAGGAARTSRRRIFAASWEDEDERLVFRICGEGFLRGMVRSLVGTLLEVGRGARPLEQFVALLAGGERGQAGETAPAHGLCLEGVDYADAPAGPPERLW